VTENLKQRIKRHEGWSPTLAPDMDGHVIGWGHNTERPISERVGNIILTEDIGDAIKDYFKLPLELRKKLSQPRREVLVEMIFQLGLPRFMEFEKMLFALNDGDFDRAAIEILDSLAAKQARNRFMEYAKIMRTGRFE